MSTSFRSLVIVSGLFVALVGCSSRAEDSAASTSDAVCSSDPGQAFRDYVVRTGGVAGAGQPITGVFDAVSSDGQTYKTQCFERRVLEYHASAGCEYRVEGRLLGKERLDARGGEPDGAAAEGTPIGAPTGKSVRADFKRHWDETGGLAENGWPISDYFWEESASVPGKRYLVQYFERAVLEAHPENAAPYDVQGQLLGAASTSCQAKAGTKPSLNIRVAAFIPGPRPGTSGPGCERVNFANIVGGLTGGIFNTDDRDFSYDLAMTQSKYALNVDLSVDGVVPGSYAKHATTSCRYDDDGGEAYPGSDGWCRLAGSPRPVVCESASDAGVGIGDVKSLGTNPDGRTGEAITLVLYGAVPVQLVAPNIDDRCTLNVYFEKGTREPVDLWAECSAKAFPSFELYVGGSPVVLHSAFGHLPLDLLGPVSTDTRHHCTRSTAGWACVQER